MHAPKGYGSQFVCVSVYYVCNTNFLKKAKSKKSYRCDNIKSEVEREKVIGNSDKVVPC